MLARLNTQHTFLLLREAGMNSSHAAILLCPFPKHACSACQCASTAIRYVAKVPEEHYNGRPIPVFGYNRKEGFMDLMFPDFTYFGHEYSQITGQLCVVTQLVVPACLHRRMPTLLYTS